MVREKIKEAILKCLENLDVPKDISFGVEHPDDFKNGDYYTNVALVLAKKVGKRPKELAEALQCDLQKEFAKSKIAVSKVEVAGAGFINFFLSPSFFVDSVKELSEKVEIKAKGKKEKVIVEYTDPNPFKEFHIGHLMTNAVGESVARIISADGTFVKHACYQGDVGLHVAKAIWGAKQKMENLKLKVESFGTKEWGEAYKIGAEKYKEDIVSQKEIEEINKKIYEKNDKEINDIYESGRKVSLEKFEEIYKKLGTKFDYYFFESETGRFGKEIVQKNIGEIFEESQGAVVFRGEKYGLHTRVFINKEGLPTYEAKELGLAKIKYEKYPYDKSIVITGNEVSEYFKVLLKAMSFVFPDLSKKTVHVGHGMLRLPSGKMSSRTGEVITGESLIEKVEEMILEKIKDRDFSEAERKEVAEKVAIGAIKFSILKSATGSDIVFDFDKSISFDGDSGPYLQYSYARAISVLRKSEDFKSTLKADFKVGELERLLYRFPEIVLRAKEELEPHYIANYLIEIAGAFNSFYAKNKILDAGPDTSYRLALTKAFTIVMEKGLSLLGISVLERM